MATQTLYGVIARNNNKAFAIVDKGGNDFIVYCLNLDKPGSTWELKADFTWLNEMSGEIKIGSLIVSAPTLMAINAGTIPMRFLNDLAKLELTDKSVGMNGWELANIFIDESRRTSGWLAKYLVKTETETAKRYVEPTERSVKPITSDYRTADTSDTDLTAWATLRHPTMTDPDVKGYVERVMWGKPEHAYLDFARENQYPVIINGEAGTGKTTASAYYSASRSLPLAVIECNTMMTEASVQGKYVPSGNGNELVWRYSAFATAITQPSVILLNETSRMPARTNALFLRVLHERELIVDTHHNEIIPLHPDCLIIADANYGYRGTMDSDQAFLDRFAVKVEFAYDTEIEKHFIPSPSLLELAEQMRRLATADGSFSVPISTRLLKNFVATAKGLSLEFAIGNFAHNFPADERASVEMLFQTYADNIATELDLVEAR